ncbi:MAG: hydrogenase nickel incorporation protein HypB [Cyclobacteriaceae bacterium]|jgi:hydrogenase nickel incorporation protein HypB|nr:hydrogenase nickel incorporation protein HypB [Cyclobacteriaceae bacterium]
MCATCGCDQPGMVKITNVRDMLFPQTHTHAHHHEHGDHNHHHSHEHHHLTEQPLKRTQIDLEMDILHKNNLLAERNRGYFAAKDITAFNLVSSPGSGKTALLECTLRDLGKELDFFVIEGDQQTTNDADRIAQYHVPVIQINTGRGCHLDSTMVWDALTDLKPKNNSVVFIENIGNLVCPSMFDLGENKRVVIISVTEGEDKPLKYPDMFAGSQVCIINKIDLLPYLKFDLPKLKEYARRINPNLHFIELSCSSGEGLDQWYAWLNNELKTASRNELVSS